MRHRTAAAIFGGTLAVLPAVAASGGAANWTNVASTEHSEDAALVGGYDPGISLVGVDGSLPEPPDPESLPAYELPAGPLGIPGTALKAYRNAADMLGKEQPACHIDWALIASIGRIESNHARGGYVDANGTTLEPILGPVLNGVGPVAAIPDTDRGQHDGDTVWDRAVGPTQFIPSTWRHYAADGNGDGKSDPNNIYDSTVATGRYLCSGGLDMANQDQLRAAVYRYNNSDTYVNTVILWAEAYRKGVTPTPDSEVPIGAPETGTTVAGPGPVPPPQAPTPPPGSTPNPNLPPTSSNEIPGSNSSDPTSSDGTTTTPTTPTCEPPTSSSSPPPTTPTPPPDGCEQSTSPTPTGGSSSAVPTS